MPGIAHVQASHVTTKTREDMLGEARKSMAGHNIGMDTSASNIYKALSLCTTSSKQKLHASAHLVFAVQLKLLLNELTGHHTDFQLVRLRL